MTATTFEQQLAKQHFATITFDHPRAEIERAANTFQDFLTLPDAIKRSLHFPARSHRASADGFTDKTTSHSKDPKQFFHWSPQLKQQPTYQALQQNQPKVSTFFETAETIYNKVEHTIVNLFDEQLDEYRHLIIKDGKLIDGILRFLSYAPQVDHNFCAEAHFDKGFSTLAIADSAPGLRIGCCNNHPLIEVQHQPGTALFMPAWMMFQASAGTIKPAWHDVIHLPKTQNINPQCARWSIVFFINSPSKSFSSWQDLHTPLH